MHENGNGTISGKASDLKTIQAVIDRLKKDKHFSDVKSPDMRESDARSHEWSYTVSFGYEAGATPPAAETAAPTTAPAQRGRR